MEKLPCTPHWDNRRGAETPSDLLERSGEVFAQIVQILYAN